MWKTFIYTPILNILVLLLTYVTFGDLGLAIVVLTIIIKALLYPLSKKAIVSQIEMSHIQGEISAIKAKKLTKEEEARETFALYKDKKVNPFSGCLVMIVQLPIIFGLYYVFLKGLDFTNAPLYSFVSAPIDIRTTFLGFIDLLEKNSIIIAIMTAATQFLQVHISPTQKIQAKANSGATGFSADLQKSMQTQVKFVFPIIVGFISYQIQAAVGLYWIVNNIITIFQEKSIARSIEKKHNIYKEVKVVK
jgi:YidC/Oxa1 family membrane protein insertase